MDRIKFMHEVLDLVMQINGGAVKRNGLGHPTAFFDYSGHVNSVYATVYPDGWIDSRKRGAEYREAVFRFDFDLDTDKRNLEKLAQFRAYVENGGQEE